MYLFLQCVVFLFQLVEHSSLSLSCLDLCTQVFSFSFQLAHDVFALLQQSLQILDLLVFISNLSQNLLQVILSIKVNKENTFLQGNQYKYTCTTFV